MAETIGSNAPSLYLQEAHRSIQQANREVPSRNLAQEQPQTPTKASDLPSSQAIPKAEHAGESGLRDPLRMGSQQAQVMAQEIGLKQAAKDERAERARDDARRRRPNNPQTNQPEDRPPPDGGHVKISI